MDARVAELAGLLICKVEQAIDQLDLQVVTHRVKTKNGSEEETREFYETVPGGIVDRAGLKQLTAVLKELQSLTPDRDREDGETGVILMPERRDEMQNAECKMQN
jgi:hypothetical protein